MWKTFYANSSSSVMIDSVLSIFPYVSNICGCYYVMVVTFFCSISLTFVRVPIVRFRRKQNTQTAKTITMMMKVPEL